MSTPRIDVDLDRIGQNAQELVRRATAGEGLPYVTSITPGGEPVQVPIEREFSSAAGQLTT